MVKRKGKTTHHCPLACKGNCIRRNGLCKTHEVYCNIHRWVHLKKDACVQCELKEYHEKESLKSLAA